MPRSPFPFGYQKQRPNVSAAEARAWMLANGADPAKVERIYPVAKARKAMPKGKASTTRMGSAAEHWVMARLRDEGYDPKADSLSRGVWDIAATRTRPDQHPVTRHVQVKSQLKFATFPVLEAVKAWQQYAEDSHPWRGRFQYDPEVSREVWLLLRTGSTRTPRFALQALVTLGPADRPSVSGPRAEQIAAALAMKQPVETFNFEQRLRTSNTDHRAKNIEHRGAS